jgi:geranylgeranylglycerol-phosphate geranylgeranyltransferase
MGRRAAAVGTAWVAHVQTWRPYTLWYVGLLSVASAGLVDADQPWTRLLTAWAAPTLGWVGGHYLGDYYDRDLDAIGKPHRPIPSGRLSPRTALGCGVGCLAAMAAVAVAGGPSTIAVAVLALAGIVGYGRVLKARGLSGNLVRGALGALVVCYGAFAAGAAWSVPLAVGCFAVAVWAHDTSSNLVGTLRDIRDDRVGGYRTYPVRRGAGPAGRTALGYYVAFAVTAAAGGLLASADPSGRVAYLVVLAAVLAVGAAAWWLVLAGRADITPGSALRAHELLVLARVAFAGAFTCLAFGVVVAAVLAGPALVATGWTQARMRARYEFGAPVEPATAGAAASE